MLKLSHAGVRTGQTGYRTVGEAQAQTYTHLRAIGLGAARITDDERLARFLVISSAARKEEPNPPKGKRWTSKQTGRNSNDDEA
jgi:hypothetical protein